MMGHALSKDGTPISYQCEGHGPPLLLVHGTGGAATRWGPLMPALGEHFTAYAIDRRGRRGSGDTEPYAVEREFEDIVAVAESAGGKVNLLGHSFGGLCALGAAMISPVVERLILYEPPIPIPGLNMFPDGLLERYERLIAEGNREEVLVEFLLKIVRMPPGEVEALRSLPAWESRLAAAHTLPRELRMHVDYQFDKDRLARLEIPVLILLGENSPSFFRQAIDVILPVLPNARLVILQGQGHSAMDTAPELFMGEVIGFLGEIK